MKDPRASAAATAVVLLCVTLAVTGSAAAHVEQPTLTAQHAFVGDPLWGLDTAEGTLLALLPDERTAQASTTKLMTLHLTVLALNAGKVQLNDQVTINAFEASIEPPNSVMADVNGVTLEEGEVVSLETLIRGMMYPSGNDAAWAIGRHVAEAYLGAGATGDDFVAMMNDHAAADGLVDTHFTSPNGWDDPSTASPAPSEFNHYTTARELAKHLAHAIQDPYFQKVIGFQGTYTDTTTGAPSGTKTYSWGWGFNYPGWEGHKGGGTLNCNGPNNGCMAMNAKRIGRRVVLAFMQGQPGAEESGLFDFGFAQIFHPDARGTSLPLANVEQQALDCLSGGRAVTATLTTSHGANVAVWDADVDASTLTKLGQAGVPSTQKGGSGGGKGPFEDVEVAAMPGGDFVVAVRKGANEELSWWTVGGGGLPVLVADGVKSGPATSLAIQPISSNRFLTVAVNPDNVLVLKSWELAAGAITQLAKFEDASRVFVEASAARPRAVDIYNGHRAFTVAASSGVTVFDTWGVDASGTITRVGESTLNGVRVDLSAAALPVEPVYAGELFPPAYYAVGFQSFGNFGLRFYRIAADGTPTPEGVLTGPPIPVEDVQVEGLGVAGAIAATRNSTGDVALTVYDAARQANNSIVPDIIAQHSAYSAATSLDVCESFSTNSEGDYVASSTGADQQLRLRAFRSGDRP